MIGCAVGLLLVATPAAGQELWAIGSGNFDRSSNLYRVDRAAGGLTATDVGELGLDLNGCALDPSSGLFYATDLLDLIEVDPGALAVRRIGRIGGGLHAVLTADAQGDLFSWGGRHQQELIRLDKQTGVGSRIGDVGMAGTALAFDPGGRLFGIAGTVFTHQLVEIDPATGAATVIGPLAATFLGGLAFLPDGTLIATTFDPIYTGAPIAAFEVDPHTAALIRRGAVVGSDLLGLRGMAASAEWLDLAPPAARTCGPAQRLPRRRLAASRAGLAARLRGARSHAGSGLRTARLRAGHARRARQHACRSFRRRRMDLRGAGATLPARRALPSRRSDELPAEPRGAARLP